METRQECDGTKTTKCLEQNNEEHFHQENTIPGFQDHRFGVDQTTAVQAHQTAFDRDIDGLFLSGHLDRISTQARVGDKSREQFECVLSVQTEGGRRDHRQRVSMHSF